MLVRKQNFRIVLTDFSEFNSADAGLTSHIDHSELDRYLTEYKKGTCESCSYFRGLKHAESFCSIPRCKLGGIEVDSTQALLDLMDNTVTQIEALDLPFFRPRKWRKPVPEAVKWDLQLWPVEERLYQYIGDGWDRLCYFYLRGFSQVIISQFFGCLQTMISAFERQLVERFRLWNDHLLPTLKMLTTIEPYIAREWPRKPKTVEYLKALIFTTDRDFVYHYFHQKAKKANGDEGVVTTDDIGFCYTVLKWCQAGTGLVGSDGKIADSFGPSEDRFTTEEIEKIRAFGKFATEHFTDQPGMEGGFAMRELTPVESLTPNIRHATSLYKEKFAM